MLETETQKHLTSTTDAEQVAHGNSLATDTDDEELYKTKPLVDGDNEWYWKTQNLMAILDKIPALLTVSGMLLSRL